MAQSFLKRLTGLGFSALSSALAQAGYRVNRFEHTDFFEPLLHRRLRRAPDFFFVQIGANDGVFADPIRNFVTRNHVAGLAVEPLKDVHARLVTNYRDYPKVKTANVAIHPTARSLDLHRIDPAKAGEVGEWSGGIASFHEHHHQISLVPREAMIRETVPCVTLMELLEQHGVKRVDLLQIDTEGFDSEVIKMIDFTRIKPAIIHFEHGLPDGVMTTAQFKTCADSLIDQGYYLVMEPYDVIAYQPAEL